MNVWMRASVNCLGIVTLLLPGASALAETRYFVGDTITVPITYSSSLPILATDFEVSVMGGRLTSLQCGGSGFVIVASSPSHCTETHLAPGSSSGTVAVATVKATQTGTLSVMAAGTLDAALGVITGGSFTGGTYQIESAPTPTPSEVSTATPTDVVLSTPSTNSALLSTSQPTATPLSSVTSTNTTSQTTNSSRSTTTTTTTSTTAPTTSSSTSIDSRLIITAQDARQNQPITIGTYHQVFFTADALPAAASPLVLNFPEGPTNTWLDLSAYMQPNQPEAMVQLPQGLILHNVIDGHAVTTLLPKGVVITAPGSTLSDGAWNGQLLAASISSSHFGNQKTVTLTVGDADHTTKFSQPAEITFAGYSYWKAVVRENEQQPFTVIEDGCGSSTASLASTVVGACLQVEGNDLHVWTNHFSQYQLSHSVISWETIVLILTEGLLLLFILRSLFPHGRSLAYTLSQTHNNPVPIRARTRHKDVKTQEETELAPESSQ